MSENQTEATATKPKRKEPEITTVTMKDGRVVEFAGKRKMLKENLTLESGEPGVRVDFINGESIICAITVGKSDDKPNGLLVELAQHGLKQKLGDEAAGLDDIDDMVLAVQELVDNLGKGTFNQVRQSDGMAGASVLLKAVVEHTGKSIDQVREWLKGKSAAEKRALRNAKGIAEIVQRLEAEKASRSKGASVDAEALLSEIQ